MIRKFGDLARVGRYRLWDGRAARRAEAQCRRLTLVYGRNGSGKSTLVRVLAAAAAQDAREVALDRTLGESAAPQVAIDTDHGVILFQGGLWRGHVPKVATFDRAFIENNVYTGRTAGKHHRKEMLRIALGTAEVEATKALDQLSTRGRELALERRAPEDVIDAATASAKVPREQFLRLAQPASSRAELEQQLADAHLAEELRRRPQPEALLPFPQIDGAAITEVLATRVETVEDAARSRVREHLEQRLGGRGEAWVRSGLEHIDGKTCPFCAQDAEDVDLFEAYRCWFDRSYDELLHRIDELRAVVARLDAWWGETRRIGAANATAFKAWADVVRPSFESERRGSQVTALRDGLAALLDSKRADPLHAMDDTAFEPLRNLAAELAAAVEAYNTGIAAARDVITARLAAARRLSVADAQRGLLLFDAAAIRHSPAVAAAVERLRSIDMERDGIERDKETAKQQLALTTQATLSAFAKKLSDLLRSLGADFAIEAIDTERGGGTTGARFTVRVEHGAFNVASKDGEARFARVLSDGDRATLAFAMFLLSLEQNEDLADTIVVLDDPMTSQDAHRSELTSRHILDLIPRCRQVLVLSHHEPFLRQIAYDFVRHRPVEVGELACLELDRLNATLTPWAPARPDQATRLRRLAAFADRPDPRSSEHVRGELRKALEHHLRESYDDLFESPTDTLEHAIRKLRNDAVRSTTRFSAAAVDELDAICSFSAGAHHDGSSVGLDTPAPEAVREYSRRTLHLIRLGTPLPTGLERQAPPHDVAVH